ncbi:hypothetical protein DICPUDRAFT_158368 [Dictyostelium purpureum]|uniref:Methyltransferase domain-containing protein n=1 Tax=Dictyostelium purpureum TaxID=5786 RepID=F1A1G1_DICPU|nr:uncharacterized protein DICPUDRAFT_158368 [Dictyostelium purpureum]EGC29973.1 hypothetical protein DICPUDRAFT_158368 [Dictyostelium purpureum]|eukprot:XP_003293512.1 hypothetical protein DICPUDRAFT_158368 [Dictyostelium purpureum]
MTYNTGCVDAQEISTESAPFETFGNKVLLPSQQSYLWDILADLLPKTLNIKESIKNPTITFFPNILFQSTIPECDKDKEMTILDIAAGSGLISLSGSRQYPNAKFISSDFSDRLVSLSNKLAQELSLPNISSLVMDGQNLDHFLDSSVDYVYSINGLNYFPNQLQSLMEMKRVLKPNGKVAIGVPCPDNFSGSVLKEATKQLLGDSFKESSQVSSSLSNPEVFELLLKQSGFQNIEIKKHFQWLDFGCSLNPIYSDHLSVVPMEKKHLFDQVLVNEIIKSDLKMEADGKFRIKASFYVATACK